MVTKQCKAGQQCEVKSIYLTETLPRLPEPTGLTGEEELKIMEDQHSVESARKDLDVIFNKINNSLKEFQIGAPEKDIEKKTEVSFQLEDQNKKTRNMIEVSTAQKFSSLPLSFRRYNYVLKTKSEDLNSLF